MDDKLLGRAVEYHGPDFLRQLQLEQEKVPSNIFLHLQKHRPQPPEINDSQFILNIRRFISKKADILFRPIEKFDHEIPDQTVDEDSYAKMPPLETFMGVDPHTTRKHLFHSLEVNDVVIAVVTSILDTGLVLQLLCLDNGKNRNIDDLRVTAFVPSKEIPLMFPTQNPVEGYQVKDYIRGVIVTVNPDNESILLSLKDTAFRDSNVHRPTLGLIHEEDFPIQYRRKLHIRGLTFDELVNSILGFSNPGNVPFLMDTLQQKHDVSMMRGLYGLKISEKDYADNLKKSQSQKWAYQCVAQGIHDFKKGLQTEAMQSFNKALQIDKSNVEAFVARGALYANNESYTRALTDFEAALSFNRKHPNAIKYMHETLLAKGKCHEDDKQFADAKQCYQRAVEIVPDSDEAKEYLRYIEYKEDYAAERDIIKVMKKERSPSPIPFKETTDKLKQLIQEDRKVSRSKSSKSGERESVDERPRRRRSPSPRHRKRRESSSSSSSTSSRSRSTKGRRSTRDSYEKARGKSPPGDVYVKKEMDSYESSRTADQRSKDRNMEKFEKSWSSGRRSKSRERCELHKNQDPPPGYQFDKDESGYSKNRNASDASAVYSFSRGNEKIPGLGESPPRESETDIMPDVLQDRDTEEPSGSRYSYDRSQPRQSYNEDPSSVRPDQQRSPSWGREASVTYVSGSKEKGDYRKRRESERTRDDEKRKYEEMLDEELYGTTDHSRRKRSRSRSPMQRNRTGSQERCVKVERHESVTPTKDEVSDKLGLEDISSPEDQFHQSDYRLRAYGSREEYDRQKYSREEKYRSKHDDEIPERSRKASRRHTPEARRHRSPDSFDASPRQRDSSYRHSSKEAYGNDDHLVERRIVSLGKKDKKTSTKRYDTEYDEFNRNEERGRANERYQSKDYYHAAEVQERRSIVIGNSKEKKTKQRSSPSSDDFDDYDKERSRKVIRRSENIDRRSRTPEKISHSHRHGSDDYENSRKRAPRYSRSSSMSPHRDSRRSRSPHKVSRRSRSPRRDSNRSKSPRRDSHQSKSPRRDSRRSRSPRRDSHRSKSPRRDSRRSKSPNLNSYRSGSPHRIFRRSRTPQKVSHQSSSPRSPSPHEDHHLSRSPSLRKGKDNRKGTHEDHEESQTHRVISVKLKKVDTKSELKSPPEFVQNAKVNSPSQTDIFADLPPPKANKDSLQMKFATYVPRAVKLKQPQPVGINPERQLSVTEQRDENVEMKVSRKSIEDVQRDRQDRSKTYNEEKIDKGSKHKSRNTSRSRDQSRSRSRSKNRRKRSRSDSYDRSKRHRRSRSGSRSRYRTRSRQKSHSRHRSDSRHRSRSRNRSRSPRRWRSPRSRSRNRSHSRKRSRSRHKSPSRHSSRSRSKSYDHQKSARKKPRKRSSSSSSSDSRSHKRTSSSKYGRKDAQKTSPKIIRKFEFNVPQVSSRWDSPEEKKSRWGGLNNAPVLLPESSVNQAQEKMVNILAASLISKSPPPHRSMKPGEKEALQKKWKELSVSPLEESDEDLPAVIKERIASVEKKILGKDDSSRKENDSERKKESIGGKNMDKMLKLRGLKSKWDSDSERSSRSRSRSAERRPQSSGKRLDEKKYSDSKEKRKSDDGKTSKKKRRSRSKSKSKNNRGRSSDKRKKSRSRSRSRSKARKSSSSRKRSSSRERSSVQKSKSKMSKQENGQSLPDVVTSSKSSATKSKKKKSRDEKSQSRSPKAKSSKSLFKSKWSSDSDSDNERSDRKKSVDSVPKDSLTELERFYNQLKNDKKRKMDKK